MKKTCFRLVALLLACVLLTGCADLGRFMDAVHGDWDAGLPKITAYDEMVYTRPDMQALEDTLARACAAAAGEKLEPIIDGIWEFYDAYDWYFTNYSLADIRYSCDLTDSYWEEEYDFCSENSARVDAMLEELYYALAKSPCLERLESDEYFGDGYFDAYQGDNNWDAEFTELLARESELIGRYYEIAGQAAAYEYGSDAYYEACFEDMAQILVELVGLRRDMAEHWGYTDFNQFATDFYHYRDYSVAETQAYLEQVRLELVELYRQVNQSDIWENGYTYSSEKMTYAYVKEAAGSMGGMVKNAFLAMDAGGLYDIQYSENKYPASFEVYLTGYREPFIFMNPSLSTYDHLTFAHEFGHFCNDYASGGSYAGVDVLEFFSQGMEYLSLCYAQDTEQLTKMKMADSLCIYIEQAAFASFEMQLYEIPEEELDTQALVELYDRVALEYGFDSVDYDPREFVTINHYYTNPLYILSYVVGNDAAMQLYQLEQEEPGSGLRIFEDNLTTEEYYLLAFLDAAGLQSPFAPGRIREVRETLESILE